MAFVNPTGSSEAGIVGLIRDVPGWGQDGWAFIPGLHQLLNVGCLWKGSLLGEGALQLCQTHKRAQLQAVCQQCF